MARVGRGDRRAFEELVRRHQGRVYNLVYRSTGSVSDSEDLVQEVFLRVFRAAPRYQPSAQFTTWLYRVATNAAINHLRRHERQPVELTRLAGAEDEGEGEGSAHLADPNGQTGLDSITSAELRARVRQAIQSLPANQRLAMILFRFEGRSYQEIAEALSCSTMAVKSLLSRARENLRDRLAPYLGAPRENSPKPAPPNPG